VLLKLGAYGFIRLVLPLYPQESRQFSGVLAVLAVLAIIFGAFSSFGQIDFKRLVAYSSVNHMGFVILGIAAAAFSQGTESGTIALNGAVLQMFNHGLSAAGMFFLVGVIYERTHTRDLRDYGGLFPLIPIFGGILVFTSMASLGLPGLNGFISEFLVVRGSWGVGWIFPIVTAFGMIGLLFTGAYILKGIKMVLHGPMNEKWSHGEHKISEISGREIIVMIPLMVLILWIGIWPSWILSIINQTVNLFF
jgi:NADH-quinone oxidoreductase subunit M